MSDPPASRAIEAARFWSRYRQRGYELRLADPRGEVAVNGPNLVENRAFAEKIRAVLAGVPSLRDLQFVQALDYPTVGVQKRP